jgi:hypothetical protein
MADPTLVQIDDVERPATAEEQAQIDAIRAGQQDNIPDLAE